jgi:hypothetical protein
VIVDGPIAQPRAKVFSRCAGKPYIDGLIGVYELNRVELLRDVYVWAYERSARQYETVRDSLPEPDPFRLRYRAALAEVVGEIVRRRIAPTSAALADLAGPILEAPDVPTFTRLVLQEVASLHEGNIARFRLRPSEFQAWRQRSGRKLTRLDKVSNIGSHPSEPRTRSE